MSFESAQTNYEGQKGWNDLTPDALMNLAVPKSRTKARPRRVATPISGLEIPVKSRPVTPAISSKVPPKSTQSMSAPPKSTPPMAQTAPTATTTATTTDITATVIQATEPDASIVKPLFEQLLDKPSKLSEAEKSSCVDKFEQQLPKLAPPHTQFVQGVLQTALRDKQEAKQMLVQYSIYNNNVSSWTVPLRRLVDQQI